MSASEPISPLPAKPAMDPSAPRLGQGFYWQDLKCGQRFRTFRRTLTETDLVQFISVTGMLEEIFIDHSQAGGTLPQRAVPAALTYSLIEGFILQTMIQGTGLALLEVHQQLLAPVAVGDTIEAMIEVTDIHPTARGGRAVVGSRIDVYNQHGTRVMTYSAARLLAGRS